MLELVQVQCPYCGEQFQTTVDCSAGSQGYVEDCAICCQPIEVFVHVDERGGLREVTTRSDREKAARGNAPRLAMRRMDV